MKKTASQKMYEAAEKELDRVMDIKGLMVFPSFAIAVKRMYGWDRKKIISCLDAISKAYEDWDVEETGKSMLQICEEKTEISVTNNQNKLWDDVSFLNSNYESKYEKLHFRNKDQQYRYATQIRREQINWIEPTLYASVFVAMHNIENYDYDDCVKLKDMMEDINSEIPVSVITDKCYEETKVRIAIKEGHFMYEEN